MDIINLISLIAIVISSINIFITTFHIIRSSERLIKTTWAPLLLSGMIVALTLFII